MASKATGERWWRLRDALLNAASLAMVLAATAPTLTQESIAAPRRF